MPENQHYPPGDVGKNRNILFAISITIYIYCKAIMGKPVHGFRVFDRVGEWPSLRAHRRWVWQSHNLCNWFRDRHVNSASHFVWACEPPRDDEFREVFQRSL
jgi:hypothetical protein